MPSDQSQSNSEILRDLIAQARERNHRNIVETIDRAMKDDAVFLLLASSFAEYMTPAHWEHLANIHPNEAIREGISRRLAEGI